MTLFILAVAAVAAFARWGVPTSANVAAGLESTARAIAAMVAVAFAAGQVTRDWVAGVADFTLRLAAKPLDTLIGLIPTVEPQPELIGALGAILLTTEELEAEIAAYDEAKPNRKTVARRKPATAPKATVAA